jgi:hypothetical protein
MTGFSTLAEQAGRLEQAALKQDSSQCLGLVAEIESICAAIRTAQQDQQLAPA